MKTPVIQTYVHQELNREVTAIGGYYVIDSVARVQFEGRDVLYLTGYAHFDTACCGVGGCCYATVIGFVVAWKSHKNQDGYDTSIVEPIRDQDSQKKIRQLIEKRETVQQVRFD
jgi:hypothetical protein